MVKAVDASGPGWKIRRLVLAMRPGSHSGKLQGLWPPHLWEQWLGKLSPEDSKYVMNTSLEAWSSMALL